MSSIFDNLFAHCFVLSLGPRKPIQSEAEQNPEVSRSLIVELGPILRRNLEHHHAVDVCGTEVRVLVPLHTLQLHENARRSYKEFVFLGEISSSYSRLGCHKFVN